MNNVSRYEKENLLIIADSLKEYLGDQPHTLFNVPKWERMVFQSQQTWVHILIDPSTTTLLIRNYHCQQHMIRN